MAELKHDLLKNKLKDVKDSDLISGSALRESTKIVESKPRATPVIKKVVIKEALPKIDLEEMGCRRWNHEIKTKASIFTDSMMGQLLSTITCLTCKHKSFTFEPFYALELPIPEKPKATLKECFQEYCNEEEVTCNIWVCPNCKEKRKAKKSLQIWRLPPILFLCFKRFRHSTEESKRNDCLVNVNLIGEDLSFLVAHNTPAKLRSVAKIYQPFAFIVELSQQAPQRVVDEWPLHMLGEEQ